MSRHRIQHACKGFPRGGQRGFNLIELTIIITIIGILVAIALPNYFASQDRAKISSVKANMHTFQTIVESYAIDFGGVYASSVASLRDAGSQAGREYWKEFPNPFTGLKGQDKAYADVSLMPAPDPANAGLVLYDPGTDGTTRPIIKYFIYGMDKSGSLILDKGDAHYLTNG